MTPFLSKASSALRAAWSAAARPDSEPGIRFVAASGGKAAELFIYDEIGPWGVTAKAFQSALAGAGSGPLTLRINSPGGDVFDGMAMHNAIKARGNVSAVVDGLAASAASYIAIAADDVAMQKNATFMIHKAWGLTVGNADDHTATAGTLDKIDGQLAAMYAAKTGADEADVLAAMKAETWMTAAEAKTAGYVDSVIEPPKKAARAQVEPVAAPATPEPAASKETIISASAHDQMRRRAYLATLD